MGKKAPARSSHGEKKLHSLGLQLPPLPVTSVGSLPKHVDLVELRYKVARGVQQVTELERKERVSTELWIREQERLGFDVLVDGEMNRSDIVSFFARKIGGFEIGGTVRSYGNRYYKKPIIKSKLEWKGPITVDVWKVAQRMTHRPLKAIVTGAYTMMDWAFNEYYSSRAEACEALAQILHKEIVVLAESGARIIQIDEPALSARPDEFSMVMDAVKEMVSGVRAYFVLHHCYANLAPIWERMQKLPVDNFSLEAVNSRFSILPLLRRRPTEKDLSIGFIDSHNHSIESSRQVMSDIKKTLASIPGRRLWLSTDCGLKTRSPEEAIGKMRHLAEAGKKCRPLVRY